MNVLLSRLFAVALLASPLAAQPAPRATVVHTAPDATSASLLLVKTGEALPAPATGVSAPAGWSAVLVPGPHVVYVENKFIDKNLDVRPNSPLHSEPKAESPVLTSTTDNDAVEITGLRGRWTQLRINRPIVGYIQGGSTAPAPLPRTAPVATTSPVQSAPVTDAGPVDANAARQAAAGHQVTRSESERTNLAALPRIFEGKLASTRAPLRPRRPYDFALETEDGTRFAYVDLTKLLLTEQIEKYLDHNVVVYGVARPVPDTKDIVISVESLQLH